MNPFKVGDKIKCFDSFILNMKINPIATVLESYDDILTCNFIGHNNFPLQPAKVHYKTCELFKEPREFWINKYNIPMCTQYVVYTTELSAKANIIGDFETIHVREVIE